MPSFLPSTAAPCAGRAATIASRCATASARSPRGIATPSASSSMTRASCAGQAQLFDSGASQAASREQLDLGALVLRAFALEEAPALLDAIELVAQAAPFRHMTTSRGWRMSVAMTNCGAAGWLSDRNGYRYDAID